MDIEESNKLIAEFMGISLQKKKYQYKSYNSSNEYYWEWDEGEVFCDSTGCIIENDEGEPIQDFDSLKYSYSWDWLMPVVEKIESLEHLGGIVRISQGGCKITFRALGDSSIYADFDYYMQHGVKGKLSAVYDAVIEFIKWYNSNGR